MTDTITRVTVGVPGPAGVGVTSAEKASYPTKSGANTFTAAQLIKLDSTTALRLQNAAGDNVAVVDTTNKEVEVWNGTDLRGFSDAGSTETWSIDGAAGNAQFDGSLTVGGRLIGNESVWTYVFDGGGSPLSTGVKFDAVVPYNATVTTWEAYADQSGSIVVDIWQDTYTNFPPTVADTITGAEKPTISAATKARPSGGLLSPWAVTSGRVLRFNIDSISTITRLTLVLYVTGT